MSLKKQFSKSKDLCKVTFTLPKAAVTLAADAIEVKLLGEFNDWKWENGVAMKASKKGYSATVELPAGQNYEFRYMINNAVWENDWAADAYVPSPFDGVDNSVVSVPSAGKRAAAKKAAPKKAASKPAAKKTVAKPYAKKTAAKKTAAKPVAKKATAKKAVAKKAPVKKAAPKKVTAKKTTAKDDLRKIEGIGPKIAELLNKAGIKSFAGLSTSKKTELKAILEAAGNRYKMHDPTTWPKQAKLAAKGKWDDLKKLQDELNGGKA